MAWEWTDIKQLAGGAYNATATENVSGEVIVININKNRVSPTQLTEHLAEILQEKVNILNAKKEDEANKLAWLITNIDITGVS